MLESKIRDIPDFPKPGIIFKDITPILADSKAFKLAVDEFAKKYKEMALDVIIGIESRGFIFGSPLAYILNTGLNIVRKQGKLPGKTICQSYDLEYGCATLEMHKDAITPGQKVLIIDDLLATGGTAKATINLVEKLGGQVVGIAFLVELTYLQGRDMLKGYDVFTIVKV